VSRSARWCGIALVAAACAVPPRDPFAAGQWALGRHDLVSALRSFDSVPVAHVHYPKARAAAAAVERSMRRGHELMVQALLLRAEWRDQEALDVLREAQELWPSLPGIQTLLAATRQRANLFGAPAVVGVVEPPTKPPPPPTVLVTAGSVPAVPAEPVRPVAAPESPAATDVLAPVASPREVAAPADPEPVAEAIQAAPAGESAPPAEPREAPAAPAEPPVRPLEREDPVAPVLVAVEGRLTRGELEGAVADLLEVAQRFPGDLRVRLRLAKLLHQRALMRYGSGALAAAIDDWQRVVELEPQNETARAMLSAARLEVAATRH
jgi:hypothetical protein